MTGDSGDRSSAGAAAASGVVAVAVSVAVSELLAALVEGAPSLLVGVGDAVIDSAPGVVERTAVSVLGSADKPVLVAGVLLVAGLLGAALGRLARRRFLPAAGGFAAFAAVGVVAASADPRSAAGAAVAVGVVSGLAGVLVLHRLLALAGRQRPARGEAVPGGPGLEPGGDGASPPTVDRRRFFAVAGATGALAAVAGSGAWLLAGRDRFSDLRAAIRLPSPARPAPPPPPGADLRLTGLTSLYTPNEEFFRIDTALRLPPVVDLRSWRLAVRGLVDRPLSLSYDDLLALPHVEADITLACVSNEVGGDLVGTARWQGVPLVALLERVGLQDDAEQVLGRSVDGFSAGFPASTAWRVPDAMVAVAMNGEPLPPEHGFPARLVVPGLYGYVSATKWLSAVELTTWDVDGYWVPRGWAKQAPIKTQCRIDVPAAGSTVRPGRRPVAGVAWAPTRGIRRVEVRVDDGPWRVARLAPALDVDCWRQWHLPWDAPPGVHRITARATDGRGAVQSPVRSTVHPDGATGHPFVVVRVEP